jgi:transposase
MKRLPQGVYTPEFRAEAVKLVLEQKMSVSAAAKQLSLPKSSLNNWVCAARAGELTAIGKDRRVPSEAELELARLRKELAETKLERDLLKKCAAYFARESR